MTIVNVYITPDLACLTADTVAYDQHLQRLPGLSDKITPLATQRMLIGHRGPALFGDMIPTILTGLNVRGIDDLAPIIDDVGGIAWNRSCQISDTGPDLDHYQIVVAGWSDKHQRMAVIGCSVTRCGGRETMPLTAAHAPGLWLNPGLPVASADDKASASDPSGLGIDVNAFNLVADMPLLMERQRALLAQTMAYPTHGDILAYGMTREGLIQGEVWPAGDPSTTDTHEMEGQAA